LSSAFWPSSTHSMLLALRFFTREESKSSKSHQEKKNIYIYKFKIKSTTTPFYRLLFLSLSPSNSQHQTRTVPTFPSCFLYSVIELGEFLLEGTALFPV
jgi:hypothetical protein